MKKISILILAALALAAQTATDGPQYNSDGTLQLPKNYREWVYLSSGLGMTYGPAASADTQNPAFDNVFVNPSSYRETRVASPAGSAPATAPRIPCASA